MFSFSKLSRCGVLPAEACTNQLSMPALQEPVEFTFTRVRGFGGPYSLLLWTSKGPNGLLNMKAPDLQGRDAKTGLLRFKGVSAL
jgi:hypothetical protein